MATSTSWCQQRFHIEDPRRPWRHIAPASPEPQPLWYLLEWVISPGGRLAGNAVRVQDGEAETLPIAGTCPGANAEEDAARFEA